MKHLLPLLCFGFIQLLTAQDFIKPMEEIRLAEAKSALNRMRFSPNVNTSNYDIVYNRLELDVDPRIAFISGEVTAYFRAKQNLNEISFDLAQNMTVVSVKQRGAELDFEQIATDELKIALATTLANGGLDSLAISYSGNPVSSGFGSFEQTQHNGNEIIWTLSEPYGAKAWWPCKQDLIDKIDSIDVFLTTPKINSNGLENIAVSNGLEQSQTVNGDLKITHYKHRYPIPAYLVAIAVTNYEIYTHNVENNGNPFPIINYVYTENLASAQASTGVTVDLMNLFTDLFEEYPFAREKYGHAQFGWGGGMEHTTVSFMGSFNRNLIAHELAHQWFGDKVTCGSWQDIWLNEGFATYLTGLSINDLDGQTAFTNWRRQLIQSITALPGGSVYLKPEDTLSVGRIFDGRLSYNKGAMVLHMLRKKLGDDQFYAGMRNYLDEPALAYEFAYTEDYQRIMQETSGQNLEEFFNDWVYGEGFPTYQLNYTQLSNNNVVINLSQSQSTTTVEFFEALVPIRIVGLNGETLDLVLDNTFNNQQFAEEVDFPISSILFDPDYDLISRENQVSLNVGDYQEELLSIFPNPVESKLFIQKPSTMEISQIMIFDPLGQLILKTSFKDPLLVDGLRTGLYFIQLTTSEGTITKSLLKN